jgi:hypothetical protein
LENIMRARFAVLTAALLIAANASAQPAQPQDRRADAQTNQRRADLVLASADSVPVQTPAADQPSQPPKHARAARVTSCRCGDQAATPDDQ